MSLAINLFSLAAVALPSVTFAQPQLLENSDSTFVSMDEPLDADLARLGLGKG